MFTFFSQIPHLAGAGWEKGCGFKKG